MALKNEIDKQNGQHGHGAEGKEPVNLVLPQSAAVAEFGQCPFECQHAARKRPGVIVCQVDQRPPQIVPGMEEEEDGGRRERRAYVWQDDVTVDSDGGAAIDFGGIIELGREWS